MNHHLRLKIILSVFMLFSTEGQALNPLTNEDPRLRAKTPNPNEPIQRLIVGFKKDYNHNAFIQSTNNQNRVQTLDNDLNFQKPWLSTQKINYLKSIGEFSTVVTTDRQISRTEMLNVLQEIRSNPNVAYADIDERIYLANLPAQPQQTNDPYDYAQWWIKSGTEKVGGANLDSDRTAAFSYPGPTKYIGVVDTGITPHPDIDTNIFSGYDFISEIADARDGDGRDANPRDEGDINYGGGNNRCPATTSSTWHGTEIASLFISIPNNNLGIAGIVPTAKVQPLRAMGVCGGYDSDVIAAMNWGAGLPVSGLSPNPTPVSVLNVSLGSVQSCNAAWQTAVDNILAAGIPIFAATGNEGSSEIIDRPANCKGVIAIMAHDEQGNRAKNTQGSEFPNIGPGTTLSAPGHKIVVISNPGIDTPTTPTMASYLERYGTSYSTAIAAATAVRMLQVNPNLNPSEIKSYITTTTRDFPPSSTACYQNSKCGYGMLDAANAIAKAQSSIDPTAEASADNFQNVTPGSTVNLTGSAQVGRSAGNGVTMVSGVWAQLSGEPVVLTQGVLTSGQSNPSMVSRNATFTVPVAASALNRTLSFRFLAADSMNRNVATLVSVTLPISTPAANLANPSTGLVPSGGSFSISTLLGLGIFGLLLLLSHKIPILRFLHKKFS